METMFWASVLFVAYVYAGYPLLLAIWARVTGRPTRARTDDLAVFPSVSIVIAAHNEGPRLPARVANLLEQQYPRPLEIIVVSDGSRDGTRAALAPFSEHVRFIELPRGGKPVALNAGVAAASGEIIVFTDARQRFAPDATLALASNFVDPEVGAVTGELILDCELHEGATESTIADGVGLYWKYEKWLRRQESRVRSTLGATGAIYAMRRSLWQPLPPQTLLDDVLAPMRVVLGGHRVVFDERAKAFDCVSPNGAAEARRKIRTLAGNYQIWALEPRLLLPFSNPVWVQYTSHKIGRLIVPWALVTTLVSSAVLAFDRWPYALALMVQLCFYGLAVFGGCRDSRSRTDGGRAEELPSVPDSTGQGRSAPELPLSRRIIAGR
jgi:cellulose synthase/poly-beta-1,6-N-acetylglucosamine synthase-like glycosyltransferase